MAVFGVAYAAAAPDEVTAAAGYVHAWAGVGDYSGACALRFAFRRFRRLPRSHYHQALLFLLRWEWYEWLGVLAPIPLLWWFRWIGRSRTCRCWNA